MNIKVEAALKQLEHYLSKADSYFLHSCYAGRDGDDEDLEAAEYYMEMSFVLILTLLDSLKFEGTYREVKEMYEKAIGSKGKLIHSRMGYEEPYLVWAHKLRIFKESIADIHEINTDEGRVPVELINILRQAVYVINDNKLFVVPPDDESDVHVRLEGILKCFYPDLKTKPVLSKPIKSFIPDTGIPSLKALLEYKYISSIEDAKRVSDEVLADTRGYASRDWSHFVFVIYETKRVKPENEWKQFLQECNIPDNVSIIVLSGEPRHRTKAVKKTSSGKTKPGNKKTAS